jgi:hypothetical protein
VDRNIQNIPREQSGGASLVEIARSGQLPLYWGSTQ